ncbi:MAG: bifunctional glutamate N-acetyltransferase/amino-acid acetyltransferase ArgJ [Gammaproteobacteria bacterium]|nr:bifunctional glutamate N-acetyltransferase/amino-acid acetyltransferase ArgJ [Gammaproteobacteria bacterium]
MAVGYQGLPRLHPVAGVEVATLSAGIKKPGRRDLVLFSLQPGSTVAAVFTRNAFCAAPVVVAREHLAQATPRYLLINTGNANAGTGEPGLRDARECCAQLAAQLQCRAAEVLPFSTGVIGEPLPVAKIVATLPGFAAALGGDGWEAAAHGIMTTDTVAKGASCQLELDGKRITITGIAKGSGMIRPDMATMLAYVATDAALEAPLLQQCLDEAVKHSFNRITVDGDTSTNDACVLMASGQSGLAIAPGSENLRQFSAAVTAICQQLAQLIVRDGEGATKFITIAVNGGRDEAECEQVAYTIAHSPLVKTALFASDPNWGRILAAVGRAGLQALDLHALAIYLGEVCIVRDGGRAADYREELGQAVTARDEITIRVELARGEAQALLWTCDFSYDYVRINAEYRS